ncbi:hypothetical protein KR009_004205, partial [Drosophila setifemur]
VDYFQRVTNYSQNHSPLGAPEDSPNPGPSLVRLIQCEHSYNVCPQIRDGNGGRLHPRRTIRQLVCAMQRKTNPGQLTDEELAQHIRNANLVLKRLRRFLTSRRRCLDFRPMSELQEAIVEQLAKEMGCSTKFYGQQQDMRYLVVYRPGAQPNPLELRARMGISNVESCPALVETKSMCVRNNKLYWHQPTQMTELQLMGQAALKPCLLGRKILEEFNGSSSSRTRRQKS